MIKAEDLRIGNRVMLLNRPFQIDGGAIYDISEGRYAVEPIVLSPAILEKCGFERDETGNLIIQLPARMLLWLANGNYAEMDLVQDCKHISFKCAHVQYLHQLQNLYHSIAQTELNVKL